MPGSLDGLACDGHSTAVLTQTEIQSLPRKAGNLPRQEREEMVEETEAQREMYHRIDFFGVTQQA